LTVHRITKELGTVHPEAEGPFVHPFGRPVAELLPLPARPRSMAWSAFFRDSDRWRADPELAQQLADLLSGTTDDLPIG
jgi:hypothetical protein